MKYSDIKKYFDIFPNDNIGLDECNKGSKRIRKQPDEYKNIKDSNKHINNHKYSVNFSGRRKNNVSDMDILNTEESFNDVDIYTKTKNYMETNQIIRKNNIRENVRDFKALDEDEVFIYCILAMLLGPWGAHLFYIKHQEKGIVYIFYSFAIISEILSFIDFIKSLNYWLSIARGKSNHINFNKFIDKLLKLPNIAIKIIFIVIAIISRIIFLFAMSYIYVMLRNGFTY